MKKKIRQLTPTEVTFICQNHPNCKGCPLTVTLPDGYHLCIPSAMMKDGIVQKRIEQEISMDDYMSTDVNEVM